MTIDELIALLKTYRDIHGNIHIIVSMPENENMYPYEVELNSGRIALDIYNHVKALNIHTLE